MRITGGKAKGILLKVIKTPNLRPSTDFLRESIFSSLGTLVKNASFLDLFAGTGAYGLECLSRGSLYGTFIEKNNYIGTTLKENLQAVLKSIGPTSNEISTSVLPINAIQYLTDSTDTFELIFIDPPYPLARKNLNNFWPLAVERLLHASHARIILEIPGDLPPPTHNRLTIAKQFGKKSYNKPTIYIFKLQ